MINEFAKLGNTLFRTDRIIGAQISRSNSNTKFPFKIIIYLDNDAMKTVTYMTTSRKEAEERISNLTGFVFEKTADENT